MTGARNLTMDGVRRKPNNVETECDWCCATVGKGEGVYSAHPSGAGVGTVAIVLCAKCDEIRTKARRARK